MSIKHPRTLLLCGIIVAWSFDFLFWKKEPGISFPIFVIACVVGGLIVLYREGGRPARNSLWLLLPILFFSTFFALRREPLTLAIDFMATLACMALFANTLTGGKWIFYNAGHILMGMLKLTGSAIARAGNALDTIVKQRREQSITDTPRVSITPFIRGLLLAAPIVMIFASLLASADPIFSKSFHDILDLFKLEKLPEYIFRAAYIMVFGYVLVGIFLHGANASGDEKVDPSIPGRFRHILGFIEAGVVLVCVDLLFLTFLTIQFRYFFGGQANIHLEGYTYSEYARRGFGELVFVAMFSLMLLMGLSAITRRESLNQRRLFTAAGGVLVAAVMVILVSAYQRLVLYEAAYGFSRLRTYTHVFMIWLGLLLVAALLLEILGRERNFVFACLLAALGFGVSLNLINVDGFIAHQNLERARQDSTAEIRESGNARWDPGLDVTYLADLSEDSIPTLLSAANSEEYPQSVRDLAAASVTCQIWATTSAGEPGPAQPWQSFNTSEYRASLVISKQIDQLLDYQPVYDDDAGWIVRLDGDDISCYGSYVD